MKGNEMETVILKNGAEEVKALVNVGLISLQNLMQSNPIAFYELVMLCRDSSHKIFSEKISDMLKDLSLVQHDGRVHDSVRNIVLSAVEGERLEMRLVDPVKE